MLQALNCVIFHNTFIHFVHLIVVLKLYFWLPKLVIQKKWHMRGKCSIYQLAERFLRSFYLSDTETSVEQNLCHESLMCQWVAADDASEMAQVLDAETTMEQIIGEE